jgi:hypothetical protein
VVIDSNTFVGGQYSVGVDLESAQATSVTRNRLSQVYYGIEVTARDSARTHTVANNVVDAMYEAVMITGQFSSPSALDLRFVVQGNTLNCRQSGYGVNLNDAHATIADNLVQGCDRGVYVSNTNADPLSTRTDSVLRNVLQLPPTVTSGIAVIENTRSVVSGNTIAGDTSGSPYSYGAIWVGAYTTCTYYFTTCEIDSRVDSNVVTGVPGMALYLSGADTVSLTANTINDVSSRGSGPVGLQGAAVALTGAFKGSVSLVGNAVRRAARDGLYFANTDTATLRVDSSLFNGNHVGVEIRQGGAILTRNRIANSDTGIIYGGSGFGSFSTNNIVGNRRMGAVSEESAIFAANNWWGDPLGPRCAQSCDPGSVAGDSISQSGIIFNPPLPSEYGFTPPFSAPPPLRVLAAVRAMPSPAAPPALLAAVAGRPTRGPAVPRAPRTLPHVVAAPRASVPPGLDPVVAQRLGERLAQRAAGLAPRAAAREVWQTRLRASVQALDAAARAAASRRAARDSVEQRRRAAAAPSPGRQQ